MKNYLSLCLLLICCVCHAQDPNKVYHPLKGVVRDGKPGTIFGVDAYSRSHPDDSSHAPTEEDLVRWGHRSPWTYDADGRHVHYYYVPGTDHAHRVVVEGPGYSHSMRSWIAQHLQVGAPIPAGFQTGRRVDVSPRSSLAAASSASPAPVHQFNSVAVLAGLVVFFVSTVALCFALFRRPAQSRQS